jgi:hypothetical protein
MNRFVGWVAGLLALALLGTVARSRFRATAISRTEAIRLETHQAPAITGTPDRVGLPEAGRRLSADEVARELAAILATNESWHWRFSQMVQVIERANLTQPDCAAVIWDFAMGQPLPNSMDAGLLEALGRCWIVADRASAWAFLADSKRLGSDSSGNFDHRQSAALSGALSKWMESDGEEALRRARSLTGSRTRSDLVLDLYLKWLHSEPETAWRNVLKASLDDDPEIADLRFTLLDFVDQKTPDLALRLARSIPTATWAQLPEEEVHHILNNWKRQHLEVAVVMLQQLPENFSPLVTFGVLNAWGKNDPNAALEWMLAHPAPDGSGESRVDSLMGELTRRDPAAAIARWDAASAEQQGKWLPTLTREWAIQDPAAASRWAEQQWRLGHGIVGLVRGAESWIRTDAAGAAAFLKEVLPTVRQPSDRQELVQLWVTAEPSAALGALREVVPAQGRDAVLSRLLPMAVAADPASAVAAVTGIRDPVLRGQTISNIGLQWSSRDPENALNWAVSLPPGSEQTAAIRSVYQVWSATQFNGSKASLERLNSIQRDDALVGIIHERMNTSVAQAADLGLMVSDSQTRSELLDSVFQRWGRSNPAAAASWLETSPIPANLREVLKSRIP